MIFKYSYKLGASSDVQKAPGSPGPAPSGSIISHLPPEQPCGQRQAWYTRWRIVPFCTWHVTVLVTVCGHQFLQGKSTNTRPFRHKTNSADYFRRKVLVSSSSPCRILAPLSSYFPLSSPTLCLETPLWCLHAFNQPHDFARSALWAVFTLWSLLR